ncbi:MAG: hypothetical protein IKV58_00520 [Oscillospiraceae bacterium]|nr:hypothetical protein [Oscillospiraceae bacterium]
MQNNSVIKNVCLQISQLADVDKIYLFSHKTDVAGELLRFKLAVVIADGNKTACERAIYSQIECPLSFDVVVYLKSEWDDFVQKPFSFANKVLKKGCVMYGA